MATQTSKDANPDSAGNLSIVIKNPQNLSDLASKFDPITSFQAAPPLSNDRDYHKQLDIPRRVSIDYGSNHTIDVQPDFRYEFVNFSSVTTEKYPTFDIRSYPHVSTFSLISYLQILLTGYVLLHDLRSRRIASSYASSFKTDPQKIYFHDILKNAIVSIEFAHLVKTFTTVYDPQRELEQFVPSLAGLLFEHDFGRSPPPSICLLAHESVASSKLNEDPDYLLQQVYSRTIITYETRAYTISIFLGGTYGIPNLSK